MRMTTLLYLEREDSYLMLHRIRKEHDENHDKWIGIGGKFEEGESPEDCLIRETREESGYELTAWRFRGIVTFVSDEWGTEYMFLYSSDSFRGSEISCSEGELEWVPKDRIGSLPIWEGDRIFLKLLAEDAPFFSLKLVYKGDALSEAVLDGKVLSAEERRSFGTEDI